MKTACPVALLSLLALSIASAPAAAQQYTYQPPPDYYRNNTAEGTIVGGGLGAVTGALIGGRGNGKEGALIGAGIGAITGRLMGKSKDRADQQQAAYGAALTQQANAQAAQLAITSYDLQQMAQAGLSDEVIIGSIRQRGARIDLSPQGLIAMKQAGVSDRVLSAAQAYTAPDGASPQRVLTSGPGGALFEPPAVVSRPVYVEQPVIVHRPPTIHFQFGRPYRGRHYHRHRHGW